MIKEIAIIGMLILLSSSQTTVTPKTQMCSCTNLLNQQDCNMQQGCTWTNQDQNNSGSSNLTITTGSCKNSTSTNTNINQTQKQIVVSQCSIYTNSTICAQSLGCAFFNNSCILFSGCSAYVQTTNFQCQLIFIQCTSDGTRCSEPKPCQQYNTSSLCQDNISTSGAKSCKWIQTEQQGQCSDKVCSDAPTKYNTNELCDGWIQGCLTTGQGCTNTLGTCSTYPQAVGCVSMIGSDGPCTANSDQGSTVCRPLACTDAPNTLLTNSDCSKFLSGCLTNGKGCVKTLLSCSTYLQTQTCASLIGSEGPCTIDTTNTTSCRALSCTDAPTTLNTNNGCNQFLKNCLTTGQGCIKTLGLCQSYTGNDTQCNLYIGSDGNCKGSGTTTPQCQARKCDDAPKTINTDSGCNQYQKDCLTNGAGCVVSLQLCQSYIGTATSCLLYKGSDGNCIAPSTQTSDGPCSLKVCSNATQNTNTNSGCQQYSYKCFTNGTGCIQQQPTCEANQYQITCEGNSSCSSGQICLDRSSCDNYYNQSLCSLNQQQYKLGSKVLLRKCTWTTSCQNTLCSSLPTTLTTDQDCDTALPGCITKGNGCVDINDNCNSYSGLITTCSKFKGLNGTQVCSQLASETNTSAQCVAITQCSQAKLYSYVTQSSNSTCDTFLKGCFFNGVDNCTNRDCSTYFGTLTTCQNINKATNSNKPQKCWKVDQPTNAATACIPRTCAHAIVTASEPFNTDLLCQNFFQSCVWNGKSIGGCQESSTACTNYTGTRSQCEMFAMSGQKCTNTVGKCIFSVMPQTSSQKYYRDCTQVLIPDRSASDYNKQIFCQQFISFSNGLNCIFQSFVSFSCNSNTNYGCGMFVPQGSNQEEMNTFCSQLKISQYDGQCFYKGGDSCSQKQCDTILAVGATNQEKQNYCQSYQGQLLTDKRCNFNLITGYCQQPQTSCAGYTISTTISSSFLQKFQYCAIQQASGKQCSYLGTGANCTTFKIVVENKNIICYNSKVNTGKLCQLNSDGSQCEVFNCALQLIQLDTGVASTNLNRQQFCSQKYQQVCGYNDSLSNNCQTIDKCVTNSTYGADVTSNRQLCLQYVYSGIPCAYMSGQTCKDFDCNDVTEGMSASTCAAYHPRCVYNGEKCITIQDYCSTYTVELFGKVNLKNCSYATSLIGGICGFSATSNPNVCKYRECQDIEIGGSDAICSNYIKICVFDGVGCINPVACSSYQAFGSNSQEKAAFCSARTPMYKGKCTFVDGASKCSEAKDSCSSYNKSDFSGSPQVVCSLLIDSKGLACQYNSGDTCSDGDCSGAPTTVSSDPDCQSYKSFCKLDISPCQLKSCSYASVDMTTDSACAQYRLGCVTNGKGCIESNSNCSDFKGNAVTCASFIGNNGSQLCGNSIAALATDSCANRACDQNSSAKNDQDCDKWIPPNGSIKYCVWNGTTGCVKPQNCSQFQGTIDTCPKFTALDGPCQGSGNSVYACVAHICLNASASYNTDALCKSWGPNCMTNGFGCIPIGQCTSIASHAVYHSYQNSLGCDLAKTCKTKPQSCGDFTTSTECINTPIAGLTLQGCGWNVKTNQCGPLSCAYLPLTLTTDHQCSQSMSNCTTTGSGCIVKGPCSTYSKQVCGIAATTDIQKVCIWSNTVCRPIQCTDNLTATSDSACDTYLSGCKSTGAGCGSNLACLQYTIQQLCKKDFNGNPCIWIQTQTTKSCINYTKCTDVISNSHKECQNISPHCTTNGINCIAITACSKFTSQVSCIIGTDGNCGWLPAQGTTNASCALFTNCPAAIGKTTQQCQQACQNQGTDGTCIWIADQSNSGSCRIQLCSDATSNIDTHKGCSAFQANTQCTTSSIGCISLTTCSQYKVQVGCVFGTDGDCFWQTPQANSTDAPICRLKQCSDNVLTTSAACLNSISGIKCVSNGANCIKQSTCSSYTTKEACLGGGLDGQCAFTPDSNQLNNGKCQLFTSCESANQDQITCNSRQDQCYFNSTTNNGTTTTQCQPHTCQTLAQASSCFPVPSFDLQSYQICILTDVKCVSGNPSSFTAANCHQSSVATYSWNPNTQKCTSCKQGSSLVNNTNNNQTNTNNLESYLVGFIIIMNLVNI